MLKIKENEILANHSTFKIGGPAKYFASAKNKEEILEAINFAENKNLPYFVLAGGSNILFRDEGYNGVIIQIKNLKFKIKNSIIEVTAG
ncbi:MAG: FAD-binding protein, partial [Patescibacteria group bacterium]